MIPNRWNEFFLALLAITWGIILMLPGDLFAGIARYQFASKVFPDWLWGLLYFFFGILLLFPIPSWLHKHLHWVLFSLWLGMTVLSLLSTFSPPTLLIASLVFVIAMFHAGLFLQSRSFGRHKA